MVSLIFSLYSLGDIDASKDNQLSGGFYEQSHSEEPLSYTYTYDELKIVLEGELQIKDTLSGEVFVAKTGQVLNISNGAALQFNSPTKARVFYVAKRGRLP
jgi:ethanolamine utilization protein EutQ